MNKYKTLQKLLTYQQSHNNQNCLHNQCHGEVQIMMVGVSLRLGRVHLIQKMRGYAGTSRMSEPIIIREREKDAITLDSLTSSQSISFFLSLIPTFDEAHASINGSLLFLPF
ncbi:hypothetical protein TNIN_438851 [Trichonephila inaurata madagascariensis]|uniref:Uncharacterized protein n=1 Tax=Trichonephila inaurata madagascariensis TaxID=2747483 RepID=A0A8X6Y7W9_9ARAC|nr:hypothetical protein TNIN_438851 [Trichonephila inaurata madagascariensis]